MGDGPLVAYGMPAVSPIVAATAFGLVAAGNADGMTDEPVTDRHGPDEPDGTPAHAASLRPPGESLTGGPDDGVDFGADDDPDADADDAEVVGAGDDAVSGAADTVPPGSKYRRLSPAGAEPPPRGGRPPCAG